MVAQLVTSTFEAAFATLPDKGWLTEAEAKTLWEELHRNGVVSSGPVLEVGCYHGRSTCLFAATGRPVYCVDPFDCFDTEDWDGRKAFKGWIDNIISRGITFDLVAPSESSPVFHKFWHEGDSQLVVPQILLWAQKVEDWEPKPVDVAYLDGDHTYDGTLRQIEKALLCKPKVIMVHDVNDNGDGVFVKRACLQLLGNWNRRVGRVAVWHLPEEKQNG